MPMYIKRCTTQLCLADNQHLAKCQEDDTIGSQTPSTLASCTAASATPAPSQPPTVAKCAGTLLAKYCYGVASPFRRTRRDNPSMKSAAACVPDCDDDISSNSCISGDPYCAASSDDDATSVLTSCSSMGVVPQQSPGASPDRSGGSVTASEDMRMQQQEAPWSTTQQPMGSVSQRSLMDSAVMALWEDCADQGLFRYDVTACATKLVPGIYGFVAQLNEGRANNKRLTEVRVDQVIQPFDTAKFNFTKAYTKEVLFAFEPSPDSSSHLLDEAPALASPNLVMINVSPIEYGHVLLVPRVLDNLPQLVDPNTALLALRFAKEADNPYFRVGYNSLGAYATINHLHFQAYYMAAPYPVERAPTTPLLGLKRRRSALKIHRLMDYPVNGFVIEIGDSIEELAVVVGEACTRMAAHNIPHNLLITDMGARVFIWPQCYAEKQAQGLVPEELLDTGVNPAVFEIAGHMVLKRREDYESISQDLAWRLLAEVSLSEERFREVSQLCFGVGPAR